MKRRYEVSYYECGLTNRIVRRFYFEIVAYFYKAWLEYKYKEKVCVEIKDYE